MVTTIKSIKDRAQLWALVGPMMAAFTIFINALSPTTTSFYLPLSALIGIVACWRWRWRGALGTSLFLFCCFIFTYGSYPVEERMWQFGMVAATALTFAIIVLALEESDAATYAGDVESQSRLDRLLLLDEELKNTQELLSHDRKEFEHQRSLLEAESKNIKQQVSTLDKTIGMLNAEVAESAKKQGLLHQEALESLRKYAQEHELLLIAQATIDEWQSSVQRGREESRTTIVEDLRRLKEEKNTALERQRLEFENEQKILHERCDQYDRERKCISEQMREYEIRDEGYAEKLQMMQHVIHEKDQQIELLQKNIQEHKEGSLEVHNVFHAVQNKIALEHNKENDANDLPADVRHAHAMYKQLRKQFDEKNKILEKTSARLSDLETSFERLKREKGEPKEYVHVLEEDLKKAREESLRWSNEVQALNALVATLSNDLAGKE